jgi:hypothetical protein
LRAHIRRNLAYLSLSLWTLAILLHCQGNVIKGYTKSNLISINQIQTILKTFIAMLYILSYVFTIYQNKSTHIHNKQFKLNSLIFNCLSMSFVECFWIPLWMSISLVKYPFLIQDDRRTLSYLMPHCSFQYHVIHMFNLKTGILFFGIFTLSSQLIPFSFGSC